MIIPNSKFLISRRKQLELTQRDVAWRVSELGLKLNDNHYSRIERGLDDYVNIKLETAFGIARALEADITECFEVKFENDVKEFSLSPEQKRKLKAGSKQTVKAGLGQYLKEYRNSKGIPARVVADAIEVHPSYIFQVEKGNASFEVMQKVAKHYGFSLEDINPSVSAPSK
ncbi:helix-turn-helix transcriptional regulator [Priestia endophytica]|uniref:helix-turn-helix domain-containing protein n=1 Tax=Priestia endophytica TaxID=135735 RepID=UPI003D2A5CA7